MTELDGDAVVMGKPTQAAKASGAVSLGRIMTTLEPDTFTSHVNLFSIADADAVELRQAPAGQNGPVVGAYQQDVNEASRWSLEDVPINEALQANFDSQTLYVNVATPMEPNGIARGQLVSEASMAPVDDSAFVVESIDPPNAAEVTSLPDSVVATLNRAPLPASVGAQAVLIEASGLDGSFADGNEVVITPASVTADGDAIMIWRPPWSEPPRLQVPSTSNSSNASSPPALFRSISTRCSASLSAA